MRLTMALAAVALAITPAFAENWDFILINAAGKPIKLVELSPAGANSWKASLKEEDVADRGPVKVNGRMTVRLDKPASQCRYDIKATFTDDTTQVWSGVNICDNSYVTVRLVGDKATITVN
ncbi:hypothetical protein [Sphingomonas sp.]|uniref:hypothetical protein n=1 Tax=Sphingomonas sp. TaxID=28214 RepID=UPI001EBF76EC|nr:hypothetical protein [Sphingomonas sp.]MBX3593703.1 hypothetical protein [Sphingomonas sp.]